MAHPPAIIPAMSKAVRPPEGNGTLYSPVFQVSFPHLDTPWTGENVKGEPVFMVNAIFDDNADLSEMSNALLIQLTKKFGAQAPSLVKAGALKFALRPKAQKGNFQGYDGTGFFAAIRARTDTPMVCLDYTSGKAVVVGQGMRDSVFYAGCYAYAAYSPFAYEKGGGKGCSLSLRTLVKVAEGERVGGGTPVSEAEAMSAVQGVVIPGITDARQPQVDGHATEVPWTMPSGEIVPSDKDLMDSLLA